MPSELYALIEDELRTKLQAVTYCRVILPLSALLEGHIFHDYIKKGNFAFAITNATKNAKPFR
jgi:hypothetical protein